MMDVAKKYDLDQPITNTTTIVKDIEDKTIDIEVFGYQ